MKVEEKIEQLFLSEIELNPNNPRKNMGDLEALAASFGDDGEPFHHITVVRDGDSFMLYDGERRFRAMKLRGTKICHAIVCDTLDEADEAAAILASDCRKELDEGERARGTQRALLLGVRPERVDGLTGRKDSARVKRGIDEAGAERYETMSLDHLAAIGEASDAGDGEAVSLLLDAGERDWAIALAKLRSERKIGRAIEAIEAACGAVGVAYCPDGGDPEGMQYLTNIGTYYGEPEGVEDDIRASVVGVDPSECAVVVRRCLDSVSAWLYGSEGAAGVDDGDGEARKWANDVASELARAAERVVRAYVGVQAGTRAATTANVDAIIREEIMSWAGGYSAPRGVDDFESRFGVALADLPFGVGGTVGCLFLMRAVPDPMPSHYFRALRDGKASDYERANVEKLLAVLAAGAADGLLDGELEACAQVRGLLEAAGEAEGE